MAKMVVIQANRILRIIVVLAFIFVGGYWVWASGNAVPVALETMAGKEVKTFDLITVEFKTSNLETGKEMEVYRWDPGMIVVNQGDQVRLQVTGFHGEKHPFIIEGLGIKEEVVKGKKTTVEFVAKEKGIYQMVCLSHTDQTTNGPMIGYIVVQ